MTVEPDVLPSLYSMGMEEVEPGVVEDTLENRRILRHVGYTWVQVVEVMEDGEGKALPLLRIMDTEEHRRWTRERNERKQELLSDPDDQDSDFLPAYELLWDAPIPYWVKSVARRWHQDVKNGHNPADEGRWLPERCRGIRADGQRCWAWSGISKRSADVRLCKTHLFTEIGAKISRDEYITTARQKLYQAAPAAADTLEAMLTAELDSVKLRAAAEILDRTGIRAGTEISGEITVTHVDAAALVRDRLAKLREAREDRLGIVRGDANVIEGEVVEG